MKTCSKWWTDPDRYMARVPVTQGEHRLSASVQSSKLTLAVLVVLPRIPGRIRRNRQTECDVTWRADPLRTCRSS